MEFSERAKQEKSLAKKVRVLLVEDDPSIAMGLQINLEKEGYEVLVARDGEEGLLFAKTKSPSLIVLDVMLPKRNGLDVLNELRTESYTAPIIILSARSDEMDKVTGLELGAEDYIAKPFSLAEFMARVRAALRRTQRRDDDRAKNQICFGDVEVDLFAREVKQGGKSLEFTQTEFDILVLLLKEQGRVLTREQIFRTVWGPNHHGTPRTIDNFIQQLRMKIGEDPANPKHLLTVRGVGYRFQV